VYLLCKTSALIDPWLLARLEFYIFNYQGRTFKQKLGVRTRKLLTYQTQADLKATHYTYSKMFTMHA